MITRRNPVGSHPSSLLLVAAAAIVSILGLLTGPGPVLANPPAQGQASGAPGLTTLLHEIGFTPELLASANGRAGVVTSLRIAAANRPELVAALSQAVETLASAKSSLERIKGGVVSDGATPGTASALSSAEQAEVQAAQAEASASGALREALLSDLEAGWPTFDGSFIRAAWANTHLGALPVEYRGLTLSAAQAERLSSAVAASASASPSLTADQQAMLSWANGQPSVAAAKQRLAAYRGEVELAFAQAMFAEAQGQ